MTARLGSVGTSERSSSRSRGTGPPGPRPAGRILVPPEPGEEVVRVGDEGLYPSQGAPVAGGTESGGNTSFGPAAGMDASREATRAP